MSPRKWAVQNEWDRDFDECVYIVECRFVDAILKNDPDYKLERRKIRKQKKRRFRAIRRAINKHALFMLENGK